MIKLKDQGGAQIVNIVSITAPVSEEVSDEEAEDLDDENSSVEKVDEPSKGSSDEKIEN